MPGEFYQKGKAEKVDIKGILDRLDHTDYGLAALKALIDAVEGKLDDGTTGLAALEALMDAVEGKLDHGEHGLAALKALIDTVEGKLDDGTYGLAALKTLVDAIGTLSAAIKGQTDKLAGTETKGVHQHQNNILWQQVFEVTTTTRKKVHSIWLDFVNLTQNMEYKLSYKVDGTNPRVFDSNSASPWTPANDDGVLIACGFVISSDFKLELKSAVLEGGTRDIPYELDMEDTE